MTSYAAATVKARKPHRCIWCKQPVQVGSFYIRVRWADGDLHGSDAYHPECMQAINADPDQVAWWNDEDCVPQMARGHTHEAGYESDKCPRCRAANPEKYANP